MNNHISSILVLLLAGIILSACGGGGGSTTPASGGGSATGVSLSGNVSMDSSDLVYATSVQDAALANANVNIYKIFPDGSETLAASTTTDANGGYAVSGLDPASGGTGSAQDFYYEVRVTRGSLDIRAPAAPEANEVVNVTPATHIAARIVSDVAEIPNSSTAMPTPDPELIEGIRELAVKDAGNLANAINMPTMGGNGAASGSIAMANGMAAAGGNAEKMYKAVQFASEAEWIQDTANSATTNEASAYIQRVIREACNQPADNPLSGKVADILGNLMVNGDTFSVRDLISAYNNSVPTNNQITESDAISKIQGMLTAIDTNLSADAGSATDFSETEQILLYVKRGMETVTADTLLSPDQAAPFLMAALEDGSGQVCDAPVVLADVFGNLTNNSILKSAHIGDVEIYHDMGFGCTATNEGHFRANVEVYTPAGVSVSGVTVVSTDSSALGGDGSENLTQQGNLWVSQTNGVCVTLDTSVTYTVSATLSDSSVLQATVTRNHPMVPEATAMVNGVAASNNVSAPDVVTERRPLYTWDSPEAMLANITNAPAGSAVKYQYEFSHIDVTDSPVAPLPQCGSVLYGPMYAVDNFLPTVDCDPAACAAAAGRNQADISCRINIQTYLVDDADKVLGQAAGNFTFFCVDTDGDGNCG